MRLYEVYQHLTEAQKYEQMFQNLSNIVDSLPDDSDAKRYLQSLIPKMPSQIKNVRKILKRQDRIMYFLRGAKYYILTDLEGHLFDDIKNAELNKDLETAQALKSIRDSVQSQGEKIISKFPNVSSDKGTTFYMDDSVFLYHIEHFLSIPYEPIQEYVWDKQTPQQILDDLETLENRWAESQKKILVPEPDDKKILEVNSKQSWWLLDREFCQKEGAAMGHCGNAPSRRPGDRVLSYRTQVSDTEVMPHLTFILHNDGYLGEMKGRTNQKPDKKYHPAIVKLLVEKQDMIKGIRSGGYAPANNFSIMDLEDKSLRKKLIDMNHNLLPGAIKVDRKDIIVEGTSEGKKACWVMDENSGELKLLLMATETVGMAVSWEDHQWACEMLLKHILDLDTQQAYALLERLGNSILDYVDDEMAKQMIDAYPSFGTFGQMIQYLGVDDERTRKKALDEIDEFAKFNDELGEFVYYHSADLEDIVDYTDNDLAKTVAKSLAGKTDMIDWFWTTDYTPDQSTIEYAFGDYFENHPEDEAKLKAYLKKEYDYDGEEDIFDFVYENSIDEVIDALNRAYHDGSAIGSEGEMIKDFESALEDMPHLHYDGDNILFADRYYIAYSPEQALEWVAEDPERFAENPEGEIEDLLLESIKDNFRFDEPNYGWQGFDETVAFERLSDELYTEIFSKDDE